jgi:hypothetical protein
MKSDEGTLRDEYPENLIKSGVRGEEAHSNLTTRRTRTRNLIRPSLNNACSSW